MSGWKMGTVAEATVYGELGVRMMRTGAGWFSVDRRHPGGYLNSDDIVTDIRPLVVLGPHDAPSVVYCLREMHRREGGEHRLRIVERIEDQTKPPKPDEPFGLGAVVEDAAGKRWVRNPDASVMCKWRSADRVWRQWPDIDAVRVLSEGVQP